MNKSTLLKESKDNIMKIKSMIDDATVRYNLSTYENNNMTSLLDDLSKNLDMLNTYILKQRKKIRHYRRKVKETQLCQK